MIVGTHAHVMQGDGWLGQTYVAYGLSNFLWWYNDAQSNDTGVLRVTLTGSTITKTEFLPAYIDRTTGQPIPSTGAEAARISAEHAALRGCTGPRPSPPVLPCDHRPAGLIGAPGDGRGLDHRRSVGAAGRARTGDAPVTGLARPGRVG